jgi:hypothetical protein
MGYLSHKPGIWQLAEDTDRSELVNESLVLLAIVDAIRFMFAGIRVDLDLSLPAASAMLLVRNAVVPHCQVVTG